MFVTVHHHDYYLIVSPISTLAHEILVWWNMNPLNNWHIFLFSFCCCYCLKWKKIFFFWCDELWTLNIAFHSFMLIHLSLICVDIFIFPKPKLCICMELIYRQIYHANKMYAYLNEIIELIDLFILKLIYVWMFSINQKPQWILNKIKFWKSWYLLHFTEHAQCTQYKQ